MFKIADESYAVANAMDELRRSPLTSSAVTKKIP